MGYLVNAFQIPNELVDRFLPELSPNAIKCYLVIVRKTIGWGKEFDAISASQFSVLTGIRKSDTIWVALRELKSLGLIEGVSIPGRPTQFKVVAPIHLKNGDTPKNGLSMHSGVQPTLKKGATLKQGTQNSSAPKLNKPTIYSSIPSQNREEEDGVVSSDFMSIASPYLILPIEGIDGLDRFTIAEGIERLVTAHAGDVTRYRDALIREVLSGGGRTLENIRKSPKHRPGRRTGSNRVPEMPIGISVFDLYEIREG